MRFRIYVFYHTFFLYSHVNFPTRNKMAWYSVSVSVYDNCHWPVIPDDLWLVSCVSCNLCDFLCYVCVCVCVACSAFPSRFWILTPVSSLQFLVPSSRLLVVPPSCLHPFIDTVNFSRVHLSYVFPFSKGQKLCHYSLDWLILHGRL